MAYHIDQNNTVNMAVCMIADGNECTFGKVFKSLRMTDEVVYPYIVKNTFSRVWPELNACIFDTLVDSIDFINTCEPH